MPIKTKLAIVAGGGDLVLSCIQACKKQNINYFIIGIDKFYINKYYKPNVKINLNEIGNIFSILHKEKIKDIIFIGSVRKPSLFKLRPNLITIYYILLILLSYFKGDNKLLSKIYKIFIKKGFQILDVRVLLKNNIANNRNNNLKLFKNKITLKQIIKYFNLAKQYGSLDRGQAIIINSNKVLLSEDRKGTDNLINRYKLLNRSDEFSLLIKICKPYQNKYLDLPTVGPDTIKNIAKSGIKGIIVEKNYSLIARPKETFKLIEKYNLLYYAV